MIWVELSHTGYGSVYNQLYVNDKQSLLLKKTNDAGKKKLASEATFYQSLQQLAISFPIPKCFTFDDTMLLLEYKADFIPLYERFYTSFTIMEQQRTLHIIREYLRLLHQQTRKLIPKSEIVAAIQDEIYGKVLQRYENARLKELFQPYQSIRMVNMIPIRTFDDIVHELQQRATQIVATLPDQIGISIIHGDPQFHNILIHKNDFQNIVFIDPRGYFGNLLSPYGLPQYDHAKVAFALSGYDIFDSMDIHELNIHSENITIPLDPIPWKKEILGSIDEITRLFFISAWLGNAHSFAERNPAKAVCSYFYALYIATIFLD